MKDRTELARLFTGNVVELGVAAGAYSEIILRESKCDFLCSIDRYSDHHDIKEYAHAAKRLAMVGQGRCFLLRMTFEEALPLIADGSRDAIYIDGYAHTGQEGGQTLEDWWPKLRIGGIFAGHDYHPAWPLTVKVVDEFAAKHGFQFKLTGEDQPGQYPSWYGVKRGV